MTDKLHKFKELADRLHKISPLISVVLFIIAVGIIRHEMEVYSWEEIKHSIASIPPSLLALALGLTVAGYFSFSLYDLLAIEYAEVMVPYRRVWLAAFIGYAVSNNMGHALFSGGSIRYRLYYGWGLKVSQIVRIILFCALAYIIGSLSLISVSYLFIPASERSVIHLPGVGLSLIAELCAAAVSMWWMAVFMVKSKFSYKGFSIGLPSPKLTAKQIAASFVDLLCAGSVLYVILTHYLDMSFSVFIVIYLLAQIAGLLSQVPGGLGVFEGVFMYLVSGQTQSPDMIASLIVFRAIYFLLPLVLAGAALVTYETRLHRFMWHGFMKRWLGNEIKTARANRYSGNKGL